MKNNTKFILILSFSILLLLQITLTVVAALSISIGLDKVDRINDENNTAHHIQTMRDAAHQRALLLYRMIYETDPFIRDDLWVEFNDQADTFLKSRVTLESKPLTVEISDKIKNALLAANRGGTIQNSIVELISDDQRLLAQSKLKKLITHQDDSFINQFSSLLKMFFSDIEKAIENLALYSQHAIQLIILLGLVAVTSGIFISIFVLRRISNSEAAFIKQKDLAQNSNAAKSIFLANMSHEIRTPLTAIIGFSEALVLEDLPEKDNKMITNSILHNSKHLHQVINDILDISKIEAGQLEIEIQDVSPAMLCSELQSIATIQAKKENLTFEIIPILPIPASVKTDSTRLKQILLNLISNALKFTHDGGVTVKIFCDIENEKLHFEVKDTGIGMDKAQCEKVFQPFTQADVSTSRQYGGTGLGLSISLILAQKLGGKLDCDSNPGVGSKFFFSISTGDISSKHLINDINIFHQHDNSNKPLEHRHCLSGDVLLAEDTIDNQRLFSMHIKNRGANIHIVENGEEAVEICRKKQFDLILMDMQMPIMDGISATKMIREFDQETRIVFLTANATKSDKDKCMAAGGDNFVTKPIDLDFFNKILSEHLPESSTKLNINKQKKGMIKIKDKFILALPNRLELLQKAFKEQDWEMLNNESHKLKGLGTTMGFPEITEINQTINQLCLDESYDQLAPLIENLSQFIHSIDDQSL